MHGVATRFESLVGGVLDRRFWLLWYCGWLAVSVSRRARRGIGGSLAGFWIGDACARWGSDIRLLGFRTAVAGVPRMTRIRYRAPLLWRGRLTQQAVGMHEFLVLGLGWGAWAAKSSRRRPPAAGLLASAAVLAARSHFVRTPTILYLGASTSANFRLFKLIQANGPALVLSALDHSHPNVLAGRPLNQYDSQMAEYFRALPNYDIAQPTTLRTRDGEWERTVRELMDMVPLIVLDLQIPAAHVVQEVEWITEGGYAHKTILVAADDSIDTATADAYGFAAITSDITACLRLLTELTARRVRLPVKRMAAPPPEAPPLVRADLLAERRTDLRRAYAALVADEDPDADLDEALGRLFDTEVERVPGGLSASVDCVLELLARWKRPVSLAMHVDRHGRADAEIGQRVNGTFLVSASGPRRAPSAPRAALAALVAAELVRNGEVASDPIVTAVAPEVVREPLPPARRRVEALRDTPLAVRLADEHLRAAAAALDGEVRSSTVDFADIDSRLHRLFGTPQRPGTAGLAASTDAALAFARSVGVSPSLYVNIDGTAWAEVGASASDRHWRWQTDRTDLPPAKALIAELLRLFE